MAATGAVSPVPVVALAPAGPCGPLSQRPELLRESALLQDFTAAEADVLGAAMQLVRAGPGQVLIAEGTVDDWMMVLLAGTVDVTKRKVGAESDGEEAGDTTRLAVIRPGAVIGEMSMLDGEPRYATCTALDEVEAAVLTRAAVGQLIHDHPAVSAKLLVKITQLLAQRLRNTSNQLVRKLRADAAVSG
ncbi:MAG: cyclic nucleotide-binding domain-containing protein [Ramlibacter sp.]|jgi:CRP/FNR family cyclic AMP-dependent transcriptional regulator|nr:cyclic nucleotide-binding domain-containing protein [Ramlibacter sp.]